MDGVNASAVDSIAASARDALSQVASLLDTQDGGVYVFAGQDTANPPVPDPDNIANIAAFYTQINAAVAGLAPPVQRGGTANATYAVATSNAAGTSPFSAYLSQLRRDCRPAPDGAGGPEPAARRSACWRAPTR